MGWTAMKNYCFDPESTLKVKRRTKAKELGEKERKRERTEQNKKRKSKRGITKLRHTF